MKRNPQTFWLENLKLADRYNHWIFSQIEPYLGKNALEVGCGNGNFTVFLAQNCDRLTGIDLNLEYVNTAKNRLLQYPNATILQGDITQLEMQNSFDTIIMLDVLEHLENDLAILQKLYSLLQPGGKLLIKVPALNSLYGEMDRAIGHYRRYNKKTLSNTFIKAGLPQPSTWYFNLAGIPGWWLNSKVLKRTTPPSEQVSLFNKVVPILSTLEKAIEPPVGLSLCAVVSKNQE